MFVSSILLLAAQAQAQQLPLSMADYQGIDDCTSGPVGAAGVLHRVTVPAAQYPDAVCLDGTRAVIYVDPNAASDDWLIVLEGGGSGFYARDDFPPADMSLGRGMWERWTGWDGSSLSNVRKSSTDWTDGVGKVRDGNLDVPMGLKCPGVLDHDGVGNDSPFRTWNKVFVNYCSSDSWTGDATVHFPAADYANAPGAGAAVEPAVDMHFRGHRIVSDVIDLLSSGAVVSTDTQEYRVPTNLHLAKRVLVAGESAGSDGVTYNLDHIASQLPGVEVRGSIGAHFKPEVGDMGEFRWWTDRDLDGLDDHGMGDEVVLDQVALVNGHLDQTCVAAGAGSACLDQLEMVARGFFDNPVFVKQDLRDSLVSGGYACSPDDPLTAIDESLCGCTVGSVVGGVCTVPRSVGLKDFVVGVYTALSEVEANVYTAGGVPVSTFGPNCGAHESLTSAQFFTDEIKSVGPVFTSYADALGAFASGAVVNVHAGDASSSRRCF